MAKKTVFAKVEERVKRKAESIMKTMDVTPDEAINMFYRVIIMKNDLPFKIRSREETSARITARAEAATDNNFQPDTDEPA